MITTTQNMICSVRCEDTASQAVRLTRGSSEEGMTNGNIEKPAVRMIPATDKPLARNAVPPRSTSASTAPASPAAGASHIQGWRP